MTDIVEVLRTMADNIDATRPEYDYSLAHKRIDDADIKTLREAANLIEALRKANSEVMATGIKSVRDTAELAIELREAKQEVARLLDVETGHRIAIANLTADCDKMARQLDEYRESFANMARERDGLWDDLELVTRERDEARREVCAHEADTTEDQQAYAKLRGWQCFAHTDGAPQ